MKNQDIKAGLFGSIGENMVAFELAKRNWYVYRPFFDTRIDFVAQKFVCKRCFSDWESKHLVHCSNPSCFNSNIDLPEKEFLKLRKCNESNCGYLFDKYSSVLDCPDCSTLMTVSTTRSRQGQRNITFICPSCNKKFNNKKNRCVKCNSKNCVEYPVCKICKSELKPRAEKCSTSGCNSTEYVMIFRTIQIKSSHEEETGKIAFNFKIQDLIDDKRHFLIVYMRKFEDFMEKHKYWVMDVEEFKRLYVTNNASTLIYQNNRLHPPSESSSSFFNEVKYNRAASLLQKAKRLNIQTSINRFKIILNNIDVFGKLNIFIQGDF